MLQILSGQTQPMLLLVVQGVMSLGLLWLFMPRMCSKPYRGFSLVVVEIASGDARKELRGRHRWQSAFYCGGDGSPQGC
jgi:hypothetical protein